MMIKMIIALLILVMLGLQPVSIITNDPDQFIQGIFCIDILLDNFFPAVKGNLTRTGTHISIVGISHFSRTVHNTTHDSYFKSLEMICTASYHLSGDLQIEQGSSTTW